MLSGRNRKIQGGIQEQHVHLQFKYAIETIKIFELVFFLFLCTNDLGNSCITILSSFSCKILV